MDGSLAKRNVVEGEKKIKRFPRNESDERYVNDSCNNLVSVNLSKDDRRIGEARTTDVPLGQVSVFIECLFLFKSNFPAAVTVRESILADGRLCTHIAMKYY